MAPLPGLAPRSVRLAAVLVDALVTLPVVVLWAVSAGSSLGLSLGMLAGHAQQRPWLAQAGAALVGTLAWVVFAASSIVLGCLTLYQWYLLSTAGQTIGKRFMGIRIVALDGEPAGFVSALVLRSWVFYALLGVEVSVSSVIIPFAGALASLLDYLPLMGPDRRCVHDYVAGTQVRWVRVVEVFVGRIVGAVAGVALVAASVAGLVNREALMQVLSAPSNTVAVVAPVAAPLAVAITPQAVPLPSAAPAPVVAPAPEKQLYQFTDAQGVLHITDDLGSVPEKYRAKVTSP